jgi:hypothetical protein
MQYDYTSVIGIPDLTFIHQRVNYSLMVDKSIEYCNYQQDSSVYSLYFSNILSDPDKSILDGIATDCTNSVIVESFFHNKRIPDKNFKVMSYDLNNKLIKESWYEVDNGDGTYSVIAQDATYVYDNQALVSITTIIYCYDGSEFSTNIVRYYKNDQGQYIEKNSEV